MKKTAPYSNQEKGYDFFFQHEKMLKKIQIFATFCYVFLNFRFLLRASSSFGLK